LKRSIPVCIGRKFDETVRAHESSGIERDYPP
jgi:hypothetical protein